jgi:hypothetical protein
VGITEQATNLLDAIRSWPNPVQAGGVVNVELDLPPALQGKPMQLSVVAIDGRVVHAQPLFGNGQHALALPALATGAYFVHIATGGKWLTGGKVVIE